MGKQLKDLVNDFKTAYNTVTDIKQFIVGDLSKVNESGDNQYPLLLLKYPQSTFEDAKFDYQFFNLEFFVFALEREDKTVEQLFSECTDQGVKVLKKFLEAHSDYILFDKKVSVDPGHVQHNDKLAGAWFKCRIRTFYGC